LHRLVRAMLPRGSIAGQNGAHATTRLVAATISYFLGPGPHPGGPRGCEEPHCFKVSPTALGRCGLRRRLGGARTSGAPVTTATKSAWQYSPSQGSQVATLLLPASLGSLVRVKAEVLELDLSAVSRSIDSDPFFSRDGPSAGRRYGSSAWHAVKVHNFCRPMGASEACCERVGSLMELAWSSRKKMTAAGLLDDVLLQEAKVTGIGNARDESICNEVTAALWALGRRPLVAERVKRARLRTGAAASTSIALLRSRQQAALATSGRGSTGSAVQMRDGLEAPSAVLALCQAPQDLRLSRATKRARTLPPLKPSATAQQAMSQGIQQKRVCALPLHVERPAAATATGSVRRQRLQGAGTPSIYALRRIVDKMRSRYVFSYALRRIVHKIRSRYECK
jgi:hypothetical protein